MSVNYVLFKNLHHSRNLKNRFFYWFKKLFGPSRITDKQFCICRKSFSFNFRVLFRPLPAAPKQLTAVKIRHLLVGYNIMSSHSTYLISQKFITSWPFDGIQTRWEMKSDCQLTKIQKWSELSGEWKKVQAKGSLYQANLGGFEPLQVTESLLGRLYAELERRLQFYTLALGS